MQEPTLWTIRKRVWWMKLHSGPFTTAFILAGLVLITALALPKAGHTISHWLFGQDVNALITEIKTSGSSKDSHSVVTVSFTTPDGSAILARERVSLGFARTHRPESNISITYLPENPQSVEVEPPRIWRWSNLPYALLLFGWGILIYAVLAYRQQMNRILQVRANCVPIKGQAVEVLTIRSPNERSRYQLVWRDSEGRLNKTLCQRDGHVFEEMLLHKWGVKARRDPSDPETAIWEGDLPVG